MLKKNYTMERAHARKISQTSINVSMSLSKPFPSHYIFVDFSCHAWYFRYHFHEHDDFIEGDKKFYLGGEDLKKLSHFFKIFKILHSKNSYFLNFYHSTPP